MEVPKSLMTKKGREDEQILAGLSIAIRCFSFFFFFTFLYNMR